MFLLDLLNEWKRCAGGGAVSEGAADAASAWRMQGSTARRETTCRSGAAHVAFARERDLYPKGSLPPGSATRSIVTIGTCVRRTGATRATPATCLPRNESRDRFRMRDCARGARAVMHRWHDASPHPVRRPASAPARTAPAPARPARSVRAESRRTPSGSSVARRPYRP